MDRAAVVGAVGEAQRRLALRRAWRWGGALTSALSGLTLALVAARLALPLRVPYLEMAAASAAAGLLAAAVLAVTWRIPPLLAAQVVDLRLAGRDRMATALEAISGSLRPGTLAAPVIDDAARWVSGRKLGNGLPATPGRGAALALALTAAALLGGWGLVGVTLPGTPAREVARTIKHEGQRLEKSAGILEEEAGAARARATRRLAPLLRDLGRRLQGERMDRQAALGSIEALGQEVEAASREVRDRRGREEGRAGERPRPGLPSELFQRRVALDRAVRQLAEIGERLGQDPSPQDRESLRRQLAALGGVGRDGDLPARAREQIEEARRRLEAGDLSGARQAVRRGAEDLDRLDAMLADEQGLDQAASQLRRSSERIARGGGAEPPPGEQPAQAEAQSTGRAPGSRPPLQEPGSGEQTPPPGPNQGTAPGQGGVEEKMGDRTARLEGERQSRQLRGQQSEGRLTVSELPGPGRPGQVRAPLGETIAIARAEADRYMERMRVPPEYRDAVRRYFEALAALR